MKNSKKALVTGGAGFIAGHIARNLQSRNYELVIVDNFKTGNSDNLPPDCHFINSDVGSGSYLDDVGDGFDLIYHFAGQSSVEISFRDPVYDIDTNARSTLLLLDYALKKSPNAHFIYASSMSVYGATGVMPKSESMSRDGTNFYAIGKRASEDYLRIYNSKGLKTTSLRLFNIYGSGQNLNNLAQGMISIYLAQALFNKKISIKGSLERTRDFVYIDDLLNYLLKIEHNPKAFSREINICSGQEFKVAEVIDVIKDVLEYEISLDLLESTPGDIPRMVGCNKLLKNLTQIDCTTSLHNGISTMVEKYRNDTYFQ